MHTPFYNPHLSYEDNCSQGPFGAFADGNVFSPGSEPREQFLGLPVHLPFGIAAGPLVNSTFVNAALDKGFHLPVYKTVRTRAYPSHPLPNILPVQVQGGKLSPQQSQKTGLRTKEHFSQPLAITNSFGVPSFPPEEWQADLECSVKHARPGQVVVGSFQGTLQGSVDDYVADFVLAARMVADTGVKVLIANLSCPNEGTSHLLCFDTLLVHRIVTAVKEKIGNTPLLLKMPYYEDEQALRSFVKTIGHLVQGLVAINTIPAKIYTSTGEQALPGHNRLISGVCGAPIKWAGLDMIKRLAALRTEFSLPLVLVGVGGVMTPEDYQEYRNHGADAVFCATGAMWNPYLAQELQQET